MTISAAPSKAERNQHKKRSLCISYISFNKL